MFGKGVEHAARPAKERWKLYKQVMHVCYISLTSGHTTAATPRGESQQAQLSHDEDEVGLL